jgi:hypothetical protein
VAAACGASTPGHSGGGSASLCVPSRGCSVHRWLTDQLICLMTSWWAHWQTWRWRKGVWDAARDFHIWSKGERRNWNQLLLSLGVQTVICGTLPVLLATLRVREHL